MFVKLSFWLYCGGANNLNQCPEKLKYSFMHQRLFQPGRYGYLVKINRPDPTTNKSIIKSFLNFSSPVPVINIILKALK